LPVVFREAAPGWRFFRIKLHKNQATQNGACGADEKW
jgi:hypothetical protein